MIDEDILLENLKIYQKEWGRCFSDLVDEIVGKVVEDVVYIVNELEKQKNVWVPCIERLPKIYDTYLVVVKLKYEWETEWEYHTDVADYTFEDGYIEGWNTFNDWNEGQECHIIAWQPLPKPYKESDTNGN